jgi:hypothetical protein
MQQAMTQSASPQQSQQVDSLNGTDGGGKPENRSLKVRLKFAGAQATVITTPAQIQGVLCSHQEQSRTAVQRSVNDEICPWVTPRIPSIFRAYYTTLQQVCADTDL